MQKLLNDDDLEIVIGGINYVPEWIMTGRKTTDFIFRDKLPIPDSQPGGGIYVEQKDVWDMTPGTEENVPLPQIAMNPEDPAENGEKFAALKLNHF